MGLRELRVHAARWSQTGRGGEGRRVVFLLSGGASGLLRGQYVVSGLRRLGWRALAVPDEVGESGARRVLRRERPDVVVFQQVFNPLSRPWLHEGRRCVLDLDDADFLSPAGAALLGRISRECVAVAAGSRFVAQWCGQHNDRVRVIWTGAPVHRRRSRVSNAERGPVVVWAANRPLKFPAEVAFVNRVLVELRRSGAGFEFLMIGAEDAAAMRRALEPSLAAGVACRIEPPMKYGQLIKRLQTAAIGLNPLCVHENPYSQGKSFGKVLAYLSAELAVVTHDVVDHAMFFRDGENGVMAEDAAAWAGRIAELLSDPAKRQRMVDAAHAGFVEKLSTGAMVRAYDGLLREVVEGREIREGLRVEG